MLAGSFCCGFEGKDCQKTKTEKQQYSNSLYNPSFWVESSDRVIKSKMRSQASSCVHLADLASPISPEIRSSGCGDCHVQSPQKYQMNSPPKKFYIMTFLEWDAKSGDNILGVCIWNEGLVFGLIKQWRQWLLQHKSHTRDKICVGWNQIPGNFWDGIKFLELVRPSNGGRRQLNQRVPRGKKRSLSSI